MSSITLGVAARSCSGYGQMFSIGNGRLIAAISGVDFVMSLPDSIAASKQIYPVGSLRETLVPCAPN